MAKFLKLVSVVFLIYPLAGCGGSDLRSAEEHIAAAQDYLDKNEPQSARIELKNALLQAPDNANARRLLGETYLTLGDGPSAQKELDQAQNLGVDPAYIQPLLARALLLQQDYDGVLAINPFQEGLTPTGRASVHASRGMALLATQKLAEAGDEFEKGLSQDAQSTDVLTGMAWLATSRQDTDQARSHIDTVLAIDPDDAEAMSLLGNLERSQGNLDAALDAYNQAIANRFANTLDKLHRIAIYIAQGNHNEARTEIGALRKEGTRNFLLDYLEGLLAYQEKHYDEAQAFFRQALEANPRHVRSLYYGGASMLLTGNLEQANDHLQRFNAKNPGFAPALKMLAWIAMQNGNYATAEQYIRQVLAQQPDDAYSLKLLAGALAGDGRNVESIDVLHKLAESSPESATMRTKLGLAMIQGGDLETGLQELESARALDPDIQQTSLAIIFTYLKNNELDKALESAITLRDKHPDSVVANAALGTVYLQRKENELAAGAFRDTLALDSGSVTAHSGLAALAVQTGKPEEAKTHYRKILEQQPGKLSTSMNLAYLLALDGGVDEMKSVLARAIETNPEALMPRLALSRYHFGQAEYSTVIEILEPVHQAGEGSFDYMRMLSESQYRSGDYAAAQDNLKTMANAAPGNVSTRYLLALTFNKLGDKEGYRKELERILELDPKHIGARHQLVKLHLNEGNVKAAQQQLIILKQHADDTAQVLVLEGDVASAAGNHTPAAEAYRRAFEKKETNINLLKLEAATWDSGDREGAIDLLKTWLEKVPADQVSSLRLASRYVDLDRQSDAIAVYTDMLEKKPDNPLVLNDLAWLLRSSDPEQALLYAEKAYKLAPGSHQVSDTLAVMLSESDPSRAQVLIRQSLNRSPGNPTYRYHQAQILKRSNKPDQALEILESLLQETSGFPQEKEARQLLKELGG